METFQGASFHSARWPEELELTGSRFALVGAGASGFQIGPTIADKVEQPHDLPAHGPMDHPESAVPRTGSSRRQVGLAALPFYGRWYRFIMTFAGIAAGNEPYRIEPTYEDPTNRSVNAMHAKRADALLSWMTSLLADRPDLVPKVVPDYPALGKRVLQDDGSWLRCLQQPNVELVRTAIDRIEPDGVVTVDGTHFPADVICYATGFRHNEFLASMDVTGRDGASLRDQWGDEPTAYLGITIPNFPNLFCMYGPGTNLASGASLFYHSEFQVHHAMELIRETLTSGARCCEVTAEAHTSYVDRYQAEIGQLVWSHPSITAQPLQEPCRQSLHPVAVAIGRLPGMDTHHRPQPLQLRLTSVHHGQLPS